jgi:hypothetical protein
MRLDDYVTLIVSISSFSGTRFAILESTFKKYCTFSGQCARASLEARITIIIRSTFVHLDNEEIFRLDEIQ